MNFIFIKLPCWIVISERYTTCKTIVKIIYSELQSERKDLLILMLMTVNPVFSNLLQWNRFYFVMCGFWWDSTERLSRWK